MRCQLLLYAIKRIATLHHTHTHTHTHTQVVSNNGCSALEDDLEEEDEKDDEKTTATQWSPEEKYFVQPSLRLLKVSCSFISHYHMDINFAHQITLDVTEILSRLIVTKGNPEDLDEILKIDTMVTNVKKLSPLYVSY